MRRVLLFFLLCLVLSTLWGGAMAEDTVLITLGGDCVLGTREEWKDRDDTFDTKIAEEGLDYPFSGLSSIFLNDDLTILNLECALTDTSKGHDWHKQHTFRGSTEYAAMLPAAGVEVVTVSNNHFIDYGSTGRESTKKALTEAGVDYCGYGDVLVKEVGGHRIGLGGCRETVWLNSSRTVYRDIKKLKEMDCDVIIYFTHWGKEYSPTHNKRQINMAQYAINSGADIVIGTHPHVPQGISVMDGVPVLWSLGNLCFGGTHDLTTFDGLLAQLKLSFNGDTYAGCSVTLLPVITSGDRPRNDFRPILASGEDRERILQLVQDDSEITIEDGMFFPAP